MTERSVSIALTSNVTSYVSGMGRAAAATKGFVSELDKSARKRQALTDLGNAAGVVGLAAAAGVAVAVKAFADFDEAMSGIQAATHESASNMETLRAAAMKAGADTAFSATEAASAVENLAKAGISTKDILAGGLDGALSLAAAGGQSVADAAESAATALTQFKLEGSDTAHVADLLAAGAGKAQGDVSDLSMALNQSGLVRSPHARR